MRAFNFRLDVLYISAAASLLSACGGSSAPVATSSTVAGASGLKNHQTFSYTGNEQTFIVPAGVRRLTVVAHGGKGAGHVDYGYTGLPGRVYAVIPVHPGDMLYVFVGASGNHGGFNGGGLGGAPGSGSLQGYTGAGASDVRMGGDKLEDRIIVAAGGGGSGDSFSYGDASGGDGGGLVGKSGGFDRNGGGGGGGSGGTQSQAGSGGAGGHGSKSSGNGQPGSNGSSGLGGNGGDGGPGNGCGYYGYCYGMPGGGGGGGYYGGGGGGGAGAGYGSSGRFDGSQGGGGGGGSSYVEPRAITSRMWTGWRAGGDGNVTFLWN